MDDFNRQKLELISDIGQLTQAIDDEVDWYIASISEKDRTRKVVARAISDEKQRELVNLAEEMYEKYR